MAKRIVAMLIMSLLSLQANAARYDRQCEGISPVLFQKKLKELAHGLRQEMAVPSPPTENEAETLARLVECDAENARSRRASCVFTQWLLNGSLRHFSWRAPVGLFMELVY